MKVVTNKKNAFLLRPLEEIIKLSPLKVSSLMILFQFSYLSKNINAWSYKYKNITIYLLKGWLFHSFIQQIFIENLLWARHGVQH